MPLPGRAGPWPVRLAEVTDDRPTAVVAQAEAMPHAPGWYTDLHHADRSLVMSEVPTEIAGALDSSTGAAGAC